MAGATNGYTKQEAALVAILADDMPHDAKDIRTEMDIDMNHLRVLISNMRKKLPTGLDIIWRNGCYQFGRRTASPYKG